MLVPETYKVLEEDFEQLLGFSVGDKIFSHCTLPLKHLFTVVSAGED
jgi:hypothetical protein